MTKNEIRHSKRLSWLLRHGAPEAGIRMDPAGWVPIDEVLAYLRLSRSTLDAVVRSNTKRRLQIDGARIRCCQGHSTGSGVSQAALEASWEAYEGDALVWHGTSAAVVASIAEAGVLPQKRTHVHLAPTLSSVVGKRAQVDVMLGVDPKLLRAAGQGIWRAPNGVILARRVDPEHIVELRAMTRRSRAQEAELRALLEGIRRSA
ncbi:MAG: RNA 2'-phosphotransferase [Nannocystaceae bacterium]